MAAREDLAQSLVEARARGVLIDISALDLVDSFSGRTPSNLAAMARVLDAQTVGVDMRPQVAITLVEFGLNLTGIQTALDVGRGLALINRLIDAETTVQVERTSAREVRTPEDVVRYVKRFATVQPR